MYFIELLNCVNIKYFICNLRLTQTRKHTYSIRTRNQRRQSAGDELESDIIESLPYSSLEELNKSHLGVCAASRSRSV